MSLVLIKNYSLGTDRRQRVAELLQNWVRARKRIHDSCVANVTLCLRTPFETAPRLVFRGKHVHSGVALININPSVRKCHVARC